MTGESVNCAGQANRQGFAKTIGRVGALAVFLGVGTALAAPGVAWADDDSTSSPAAAGSQSSSPGSASGLGGRGPGAPKTDSGPAAASEALGPSPTSSNVPKPEVNSAVQSTVKSARDRLTSRSAAPNSDGPGVDGAGRGINEEIAADDKGSDLDVKTRPSSAPRAVSRVSASTVEVTPEFSEEAVAPTPAPITTVATPETLAHRFVEAMPEVARDSAVEPAPTPPVASLARVDTRPMTALFAPRAGVDTTIPATSPVAWTMLAYSRRQLGGEADTEFISAVGPPGTPQQLAAEQVVPVAGPDALVADRPRLLRSFVTGFLKLATDIGVGLERTAAGLEDSPLEDMVDRIEQRYGYLPALVVRTAFDGLIAVLGPILLADVDPLEPVSGSVDVNNAVAESATFEINSDQYLIDIGSPQNVGNGELARVIAGAIDGDSDDSDIHQILAELYTGKSRTLTNRRAGINGVTLVEITPTSYTLALDNNGVIDTLTLTGPVVEDAVAPYLDEPLPAPPARSRRQELREEVGRLLGDLRERPLATIVEQVRFTLSDTLNFAFSVPVLKALFEAIAPGLNVADTDPLTEEPVIDVANGVSETASLAIPTGEFVFEIGSPFSVGTQGGSSFLSHLLGLPISELSGILRNEVDADDNDNDAQQLLEEILSGRSGAVLDFETEPGIDGVELVGLTPVSFTLAFEDGEAATDRLTLEGPGAEAILAEFDARDGADLADGHNNLSLIEVGTDTLELGDQAENPIYDVVGAEFAGDDDLENLIGAAKDPSYPVVTLISEGPGSVSVRIDNAATGEFDLLVFYDPTDATTLL